MGPGSALNKPCNSFHFKADLCIWGGEKAEGLSDACELWVGISPGGSEGALHRGCSGLRTGEQ